MREIQAASITEAIAALCRQAAYHLGEGVEDALQKAAAEETAPTAQAALHMTLDNARIAAQERFPLCQDTGMAVVFADIGQDVHIQGDFSAAVQQGVRQGYSGLRASVLSPLTRLNTRDNTPAVVHVRLVPGDALHLTLAPKGFGSENMSRLAMLKPADGEEGVVAFVQETVRLAGGNPCPPVILGVGVGGTMELCCLMAKHALLRPVGSIHPDPEAAALEAKLLQAANATGVGAQGWGGRVTALAAFVELHPTHIAGLPVAVNMQCHVARHASVTL